MPPLTGRPASKTSGLAIASLICSCAGLLLAFVGTIPGIILGLKALRRIRANPALSGKGLAIAGLATGLVLTLVWIPLAFILSVATVSGFRAARAFQAQQAAALRSGGVATNEDITIDLSSDTSGWMADLAGVSLPDTAAEGRLGGVVFKPTEIELQGYPSSDLEFTYRLSTSTREELMALTIEFGQEDVTKYSGRAITVSKDGEVKVQPSEGWTQRPPRFRLIWTEPGTKPFRERVHDTFTLSYPCALRLEFGQLKDGKLPGRIYLCILDKNKSLLRGKFTATVSQNTSFPGAAPGTPRPDEPPADTNPDAAGWTLDLRDATIPEGMPTGRVHGISFKTERAALEGPMIKLRQGRGFFPDREFEILVWDAIAEPARLGGRTIEVQPGDSGPKPQVRVSWMNPGGQLPESITANTYAMKLEMGAVKNGWITGRIYLCVADHEKSFVRGKFTLALGQRVLAAPPNASPRPPVQPSLPVMPPRKR